MRIFIDSKAKVKIGPFSRGGQTRIAEYQQAADHAMAHVERAVPCGILEMESGQLTIGFGENTSTSDTVTDIVDVNLVFDARNAKGEKNA